MSESQAVSLMTAKGPEEDWTGLSSAASRRKLQNRLNQRASRRRKLEQQRNRNEDWNRVSKWIVYVDADKNKEENQKSIHLTSANYASVVKLRSKVQKCRFCELEPHEKKDFLQKLHDVVHNSMTRNLLDGELLAPVSQFNIFRAMISNATYLGLTMDLLREDISSPFNIILPESANLNLPPSLQPTTLQRQVIHHPWIDLCPIASMRDALLRRMGQYDEDEICHDLFNGSEESERHTGLVVWGEAWDPMSYEISSAILRKWSWLVHDCPDIIISTNYWRALREEEPLQASADTNTRV